MQNVVNEFYNGTGLLSYGAYFNMCIGGRGIGKTFFWKKFCLTKWLKSGQEFVYLRRTQTELDEIDKEKFFTIELLTQAFKNFELVDIKVTRKGTDISFKCDNKEHKLDVDTNIISITARRITINGSILAYMKALSTWVKLKGSEYDNVFTILFDEVLIDIASSNKLYLPNEYDALIQLISSVFRNRTNVRIILLSNATNYNNPYFNHFNFLGDNGKRFWTLKKDKHVFGVIEFPPNIVLTKENNLDFYFLSENTQVFESNINNTFQLKNDGNIGKLKGEKTRLYAIYNNGLCMTLFNVDGLFYVAKGYDKNLPVYTFNIKNVDYGYIFLARNDPIPKHIRSCFYHNKIYYEDMQVKIVFCDAIRNII